jgi:hypothetical protein
MDEEPTPAQRQRARMRLMAAIREARSLDVSLVASVLRDSGQPLLPRFRALIELSEGDARSHEQLAALVGEFDGGNEDRLAVLARKLADRRYDTMQEVIADRGYRRVHTTALGAGALMMWSDVQRGDIKRHWRHGIATGLIASLAVGDHPTLRDRAFPAGLLHELGHLGLMTAPEGERREWVGPELVADTGGRLLAAELGFPEWLSEVLFSCPLGPLGDEALESAIGLGCVATAEVGYPTTPYETVVPPRPAPRTAAVVQLLRTLDEEGGAPWLRSRIGAMQLAAQGQLTAALAAL